MDSSSPNVTHNFPPFFRVYDDGRVERYIPSPFVPPSLDSQAGVEFTDSFVSQETNQKARIFKPATLKDPDKKLPLVVHYHGGGFCIGSAFGPTTTRFLTDLVSGSELIAVSIGYRLAPESPLPIAYEDSWSGFQWVASHTSGQGPNEWLNKYADFNRVFLVAESAGANLAHHVAVQVGATGLENVNPCGLVLLHPYFADQEQDGMICYLYPGSGRVEDNPRLCPKADPDLAKMACKEVLIYVAEYDSLKSRGLSYCETLKSSGWAGNLELVENKREGHCFYLFNPNSENVRPLMQKMVDFIRKH